MNRFLSISKSTKVLTNYYSKLEILLLKICVTTIIAEDEPLVYLNQTIPCKNCPFQLMSGNGQADEMDQLNLDYKVSVTIDKHDKPPHHLLLRIKLTRLIKRSFVEYVFPTGVLVIVSWVRSTISHSSIPSRESLPYYPIHLKEKIISKLIQKSKVVYLRCQKVGQYCKPCLKY